MSPKHQRQPDVSATKIYGSPNTSGYYPVVQESRPQSVQPSGAEDARGSLIPVEVRVLFRGQETAPVYEIWTERTVYEFDRSLSCSAVRDAKSGALKPAHPCLGARLLGGRVSEDKLINVSSPLPAVGHNALLGDDEHAMTVTSPVTRVVMNLCRWSYSSVPPRAQEK